MQGWIALVPRSRTAKTARETPTDPFDPMGTSTTIITFEEFFSRNAAHSASGDWEVTARVRHEGLAGAPTIYVVWGAYPLPPAVGAVLPTTEVPGGQTREYSFSGVTAAAGLHVVVANGNPNQSCVVDRFVRNVQQ